MLGASVRCTAPRQMRHEPGHLRHRRPCGVGAVVLRCRSAYQSPAAWIARACGDRGGRHRHVPSLGVRRGPPYGDGVRIGRGSFHRRSIGADGCWHRFASLAGLGNLEHRLRASDCERGIHGQHFVVHRSIGPFPWPPHYGYRGLYEQGPQACRSRDHGNLGRLWDRAVPEFAQELFCEGSGATPRAQAVHTPGSFASAYDRDFGHLHAVVEPRRPSLVGHIPRGHNLRRLAGGCRSVGEAGQTPHTVDGSDLLRRGRSLRDSYRRLVHTRGLVEGRHFRRRPVHRREGVLCLARGRQPLGYWLGDGHPWRIRHPRSSLGLHIRARGPEVILHRALGARVRLGDSALHLPQGVATLPCSADPF
mmetsp:Transcript_22809/g.65783  ORF Transcript_22809/g.65783 Transcript_22809/m.65783 type:complete len:363 (-) Transcript_22809:577-1665(-)